MRFDRAAGILLHPTSLPGPFPVGDLGPAARAFASTLARAGQTLWQVLPLGPTGYGDSPYQCLSAFAGSPWLISPQDLCEDGLLAPKDIPSPALPGPADFGAAIAVKRPLLQKAGAAFRASASAQERSAFDAFCVKEAAWLEDYALFRVLHDLHGGPWTRWPAGLAGRTAAALHAARRDHAAALDQVRFEQYAFHRQWTRLRAHARQQGIEIIGDLPIFVAHDSADVWARRDLFQLDARGRPAVQAGVPPDYFSKTGQLWGNPLYDWAALAAEGQEWWIARMRGALALFDRVRLDHFRGFEAYWEVPGADPTAEHGRWVKGPGRRFFKALEARLGALPVIAEDLGVITPEVDALRQECGYPGMAVLLFAFASGARNVHLPHLHRTDQVVYVGTHDNDTAVSWWTGGAGESTRKPRAVAREKAFARRYLGTDGVEIHWDLVRTAYASVADTALVTAQDVLGLDGTARMNLPGRPAGNWAWRLEEGAFTPEIAARLRGLARTYGRHPRPRTERS